MARIIGFLSILASGSALWAAPLLPAIIGHDFNFGAYNQEPGAIEWAANGTQPDTLVYTQYNLSSAQRDAEVTAYWPNWPSPPVYPVWDLQGFPDYAGDLKLAVQFTGQDAPYVGPGGTIDVSLIGTGFNTAPGAADLEIYGTIGFGAFTLSGLLWAVDLDAVSLYGYSNRDTYVLEGTGTVVGGLVAQHFQIIGQPGGVRGNLDFVDRPGGWLPPVYNPTVDDRTDLVRAAYSGETGVVVPEPAALGLLVIGLGVLRRR